MDLKIELKYRPPAAAPLPRTSQRFDRPWVSGLASQVVGARKQSSANRLAWDSLLVKWERCDGRWKEETDKTLKSCLPFTRASPDHLRFHRRLITFTSRSRRSSKTFSFFFSPFLFYPCFPPFPEALAKFRVEGRTERRFFGVFFFIFRQQQQWRMERFKSTAAAAAAAARFDSSRE